MYSGGWSARWDQLLGDIPDAVWAWAPKCTRDTQFDGYKSMSFGVLEEVDGCDWEGGPGVRSMHTTTYTATDRADGATCTAKYILTVHEPYEKNYPDVVTPCVKTNTQPCSDWAFVNPLASGTETLSLSLAQAVSWTVGVTIGTSMKVSEWFAATLGFSASYTRAVTATAGVSIPDVPPGYGTYLEPFDLVDIHDSQVDCWDEGGYAGAQPAHFSVPCDPAGGVQAHMPLRRSMN